MNVADLTADFVRIVGIRFTGRPMSQPLVLPLVLSGRHAHHFLDGLVERGGCNYRIRITIAGYGLFHHDAKAFSVWQALGEGDQRIGPGFLDELVYQRHGAYFHPKEWRIDVGFAPGRLVWQDAGYAAFLEYVHQAQQAFSVTTHQSEEHTSELQSRPHLVCRLLLEK